MKGKQILASLLVLALLGAYYYFIEVKKKGEDDKAKVSGEKLVPALSAGTAVSMEIQSAAGDILLKKTGSDWSMEKPMQVPADNSACESALSQLASGKYTRKLENINPADFGLAEPLLKVSVTGDDNKKHGINFGQVNPTGEGVYAALSGDTVNAYMAQASLKNIFDKKVFDWRDKKILNIRSMDIDRIEVALKDKKYTLVKTGGAWTVRSAGNAPARADRVKSLIDQFIAAEARNMLEPSPSNLSKYGLTAPKEFIAFYSGKEEQALSFGKKDEKTNTCFTSGTYHSDIMEVPEGSYKGIFAQDYLLEKRVAVFDQAKAVKLSLKYQGREVLAFRKTVKNKPEAWDIKEAKGFKDDEKKRISPASVIYYVSGLEYKDAITPKTGVNEEALYGIKAAQGIDIYGEKDVVLVSLLIGKQVEGKQEFYIKVPLTGSIYTVEKNFIQGLNIPGLEVK